MKIAFKEIKGRAVFFIQIPGREIFRGIKMFPSLEMTENGKYNVCFWNEERKIEKIFLNPEDLVETKVEVKFKDLKENQGFRLRDIFTGQDLIGKKIPTKGQDFKINSLLDGEEIYIDENLLVEIGEF